MMLYQEPRVEQRISFAKLAVVSTSIITVIGAVAFFFGGFFQSGDTMAATSTISASSSVNANTNPFSSLGDGDSIYIYGVFNINEDYDAHEEHAITIVVDGSQAQLKIFKDRTLKLGSGSSVVLLNGGSITSTGNCSSTAEIVIDEDLVANCNGTDAASFSDINAAGGINTGGSQLPVSWLKVNAAFLADNEVEVNWSTATEINNSHFTIQYSQDGQEWYDGNVVSSKSPSGNSNSILHYSEIHRLPFTVNEAWYRVKQEDYDGTVDFSKTIMVTMENEQNVVIGTLGNNKVSVRVLNQINPTAIVNVFDEGGQLISHTTIEDQQEISVSHPGVYLFEINHGTRTEMIKHFVK